MIVSSFVKLSFSTLTWLLAEVLFEFVLIESILLFNSSLSSEELWLILFNSSCASLISCLASSEVTAFLRLRIGAVIKLPSSV